MISVFRSTWPLLLGIMLLMVGNGMQGTLLGIRGGIEGIPTLQMSVVMSTYFAGFLLGSLVVPGLISTVGHVRVFAALGSLISAVLVLYAVAPNWIAWAGLRFIIGLSFCGVYIASESWLNAGTSNEQRGQALSAYMIVQMLGVVAAQFLLNVGDPAGYLLFVIPSVLVSLSFTPILLTAKPVPAFETNQRMSFGRLYKASPLGCIGIFLTGGVFSAMFGMSAVWGAEVGLTVRQISTFVAAIYVGGLLVQYPLGWLSDRYDRRKLIVGLAAIGAMAAFATVILQPSFWGLITIAAVLGGVANPIYALLLAYTNDYLDTSDMASASAGLLFINGLGSMTGPLITGWLMAQIGPDGFWIYISLLLAALTGYALWRMTRRPSLSPDETVNYVVINPTATSLAVGAVLDEAQTALEAEIEAAAEEEAAAQEATSEAEDAAAPEEQAPETAADAPADTPPSKG